MIKNITALEIKVGERAYKLLCEIDSPLGEVHDVISQMKAFVVNKINEAHAANQPATEPAVKDVEAVIEG